MEDKRVTRFAAGHVPASSTGPTARHAIRGLALHCSLPAPPERFSALSFHLYFHGIIKPRMFRKRFLTV